eukprot:TRINITY_DN53769_c0_g1_i1.p2 TRINITY_DN53769_c0_g1~~TRINITY_DN53769_c0_g1_i1.p2  ORF type:complete len:219 (-),score=51.79 TRINITY_DN53769_c0_g1_i1:78-710(-)
MDFGLLISKTLSIGILAGSFGYKVPQILKIVSGKSAKGVSAQMLAMELVAFTISFCYSYAKGYSITTYGESIVGAAANVLLLILVSKYNKSPPLSLTLAALVAYGAWVAGHISQTIPFAFLELLQIWAAIPISVASRVPQIISNFRNRSTGQLAFATFFLSLAGGTARIFTTWRETGDQVLMLAFTIGAVFNGIIVLQFLLYWNSKDKKN